MIASPFPQIQNGTADTVLAGVWFTILRDLDIDFSRLDDLVEQYSRKMTHLSQAKRTQHYGNVSSDLKDASMTWATFLRGPQHLGAKKMTIDFILRHLRAQSRHRLVVEYPPPNQPEKPIKTGEGGKGAKTPTELSLLFMRMLHELGVTMPVFNSLLTSYMRRILRVETTPSNRTHVRNNFKKEFTHPRLSWASFIKGLDFLTITTVEMEITLEFSGRRGKTTHHRVILDINQISDMLADMDESEFLNPPEEQNNGNERDDTGADE